MPQIRNGCNPSDGGYCGQPCGGCVVIIGEGVIHRSVEIVNLPQAVAAEGKGVGQRADAVLAGVEGVVRSVL